MSSLVIQILELAGKWKLGKGLCKIEWGENNVERDYVTSARILKRKEFEIQIYQ